VHDRDEIRLTTLARAIGCASTTGSGVLWRTGFTESSSRRLGPAANGEHPKGLEAAPTRHTTGEVAWASRN
jgi:hypothetical protein